MTNPTDHASGVASMPAIGWTPLAWFAHLSPAHSFGEIVMGRERRRRMDHDVVALDDAALIRHLDDTEVMTELIRRHRNRLMAMAVPMVRNRADAEEIVQDTFVQAFRSANTFRGDAKVSTWLHSICYRQVLARTRRKRHLTVAIDNTVEPAAHSHDDAFRLALQAAVDELPAINREAFILVEMLGFSRADAADIIGVEANTMRARLARAHALLTDALTDEVMS